MKMTNAALDSIRDIQLQIADETIVLIIRSECTGYTILNFPLIIIRCWSNNIWYHINRTGM